MTTKELEGIPGHYIHNNGDLDRVLILEYDKKSDRVWVKWQDGFVNMVPFDRIELISD